MTFKTWLMSHAALMPRFWDHARLEAIRFALWNPSSGVEPWHPPKIGYASHVLWALKEMQKLDQPWAKA